MAKKILVIDDDETLRSMVSLTLAKRGHEIVESGDGADCMSLALQHLPSLVICDVKMEGTDGYQALASLRADPITASIPFILMTAEADKAGMRQGMVLGADDYLPKPFSTSDLLAAVDAQERKSSIRVKEAEKKLSELRANLNLSLPHELYTPLNGILGFGDMLQTLADSIQPAEIKEMAKSITDSAERLHRLVQNYLFYAQIETLATDARKCEVLRTAQSGSVRDQLSLTAQKLAEPGERQADLILAITDANVAMSHEYLLKIVAELVQNAFKFSTPGTVVRMVTNIQEGQFVMEVQDFGRGFTTEQIASIGAYTQFGRKLHEQQGLGLGLVIVKRLVEIHNGVFSATTDADSRQTTIKLVLPLADPNEPLWG